MILVVDGQNLAFACNMTQELSTSYNHPTHATLGFLRSLGAVCDRFNAKQIYVAWDGGRSTQRLALYHDYKANRNVLKNDPEWLRRREALDKQIEDIKKLLSMLGAKQIWGDNLEGDDIIAHLVGSTSDMGLHSTIISADKDFWQLVNTFTGVFNPVNNGCKHKHVTMDNFKEATSLQTPAQYIEFKAMVGDPSDGIPGCKGVGEKTALKILHDFGSYDAFYNAVICEGSYNPGALEMRAIKDSVNFEMSRKLMDLKNPMCDGMSNLNAIAGWRDLDAYSKFMEQLDIRTGPAILDLYASFLEVK